MLPCAVLLDPEAPERGILQDRWMARGGAMRDASTRAGRFVVRALALAASSLVALTTVSCVPLPTTPSNGTWGSPTDSERASPRPPPSPSPSYEALADPSTPALDAGEVTFYPATFDADYPESDPEIAEVAAWGEPKAPSTSLRDRLFLGHRDGDLRDGDLRDGNLRPATPPPTISIGATDRERSRPRPSAAESLTARREGLLLELDVYRTRDERDLGDSERIAKHRVQIQLMALHFLLDSDDPSYLEPLIESLAHPYEPSKEHSLLRASFYESIDLERRSAEVLATLSAGGTLGRSAIVPASLRSFRIAPPIVCTQIEGLGRYRTVDRTTFRPGTELRLYVEIFGIENSETSGKFRQRLEVEFSLSDRDGKTRGSQTSRTEGPPVDEPVIDSFLNLRYSLPREIPYGAATLHITVRDVISGAVSRQKLALQIEP